MNEQRDGIEISGIAALNPLKITRCHNKKWLKNRVFHPQPKRPGLALAAYPANMDTLRIQIFGKTEIGYLNSLDVSQRQRCLEEYLKLRFPGIIVSSGLSIPRMLVELAGKNQTPILLSQLSTSILISRLSAHLYRHFSKKEKRNGVLMEILGQGVMIIGSSGVGKSETALELLNKGHLLIADDVVEFYLNNNDDPVGCASPIIQNLMEVRGLGIINIKEIFGPLSVLDEKKLELVIMLERWDPKKKYDRLGEHTLSYAILGVEIPMTVLPVAPGRNVSTLIEVAVRFFIMRKSGKKTFLEKMGTKVGKRRIHP